MIHRLKDIAVFIPMTVIYGARSSADSSICQQIQELRKESFVDTHVRCEMLFLLCRLNNIVVAFPIVFYSFYNCCYVKVL